MGKRHWLAVQCIALIACGEVHGSEPPDAAPEADAWVDAALPEAKPPQWALLAGATGSRIEPDPNDPNNPDGNRDVPIDPVRIYAPIGGVLRLAWESAETDFVHAVAWGDFDGDGRADFVAGAFHGRDRVYHAEADGKYLPVWASTVGTTEAIAVADVDGDRDLDIVAGDGKGVRVIVNQGGGRFMDTRAAERGWVQDMAVGDYDADGDPDVAIVTGDYTDKGHVEVLGNDAGKLSTRWTLNTTDGATTSIVMGDYDRDGDQDIAIGYRDGVRVLRCDGPTMFVSAFESATEMPLLVTYTPAVAWFDADGDGDLDLALGGPRKANAANKHVSAFVLRNVGGSFTKIWTSPMEAHGDAIAAADYDGDGDVDLALTEAPIRLVENVGGSFAMGWEAPINAAYTSLAWTVRP